MTKLLVRLRSMEDVRRFVDLASLCTGPVLAETADGSVDAKSLIGMFTVDLQKPVALAVDDADAEPLRERLGRLLCCE